MTQIHLEQLDGRITKLETMFSVFYGPALEVQLCDTDWELLMKGAK